MNLHKQYIEETNQTESYVEWLENKLSEQPTSVTAKYDFNHVDNFIPGESYLKNLGDDPETEIVYDVDYLSYATEIWFLRKLSHSEMEQVEGIINYWSSIPYVSTEGNYGIEWATRNGMSRCLINIDFTKSSSDDYGARNILELLAEWVENGTPERKTKHYTRLIEGVMRPLRIACDCP